MTTKHESPENEHGSVRIRSSQYGMLLQRMIAFHKKAAHFWDTQGFDEVAYFHGKEILRLYAAIRKNTLLTK